MAELLGMALHVINIILALGLLYVYIQNYKQLKARITLGLIFFAVIFLIQGLMNIYFDATMIMYSSPSAEIASMFLESIKAVGFAVLLWISWE